MERTEPLDFDARVSDWRNEGWDGRYDETAWIDRAAAEPVAADTRSVAGTAGAATGASGALGTTGMEAAAVPATEPPAGARAARTGGATEERIPVVEEQLRVGKREVSGGVERPVEQQVSLHQESVHVDRQPVDEPVLAGGAKIAERLGISDSSVHRNYHPRAVPAGVSSIRTPHRTLQAHGWKKRSGSGPSGRVAPAGGLSQPAKCRTGGRRRAQGE
jgi:hypothetical protein